MVLVTMESGLMTCNMVRARSAGQMAAFTTESIFKVKSTDVGCTAGATEVNMMGNGAKIKLRD